MFESNVFDFFSDEDIKKPINLKAIIGPDLIYDHNLDPETFTGKICGCAMVQSKELFKEIKVLSGAFGNHDSLYNDYRYSREEYHELNPDKPKIPMIELGCLYGFVTDNGYFLTRFQACQVGMRNGQVQSKYETAIKSYSVKKWERNPYPPSEFVIKA
ncbi:MAG: hypothetical protein RR877_00855 [Aurantimicrobium sp.]|uniref:hypothetical protein n=1 Tax=Aurantimicrobium sp. TaxID=1930784 RepID=UPI002FCC1F7E